MIILELILFTLQGPVPERSIGINPGLKFCSGSVFYIPMHLLSVAFCVIITVSHNKGSTVICNLELHVLRQENHA